MHRHRIAIDQKMHLIEYVYKTPESLKCIRMHSRRQGVTMRLLKWMTTPQCFLLSSVIFYLISLTVGANVQLYLGR